ncbi:MAG: hypothetical protein CBR30_01005 [Dictyoglomus sp. NZ13-RE01]|nr:MAG: hypothetical protein CBR30_01005 [Dictyoglomus sp. NZ13-RE01]
MLSFHFANGRIKVLEGSFQKKNFKIEKSFAIDLFSVDFGSRGEGEKISNIIKEELEKNNVKEKDLYLTLETKDFMLRVMEFPTMPIKELRENIIDELEEFYSFREKDMDLSFSLLPSEKDKIKALVVTYPKSIVKFWKELSERLSLNLKYMEISSLSFIRGLTLENYDFSKNIAIIFLGNDVTDIYLFQKGNLYNLYNLSIGTSDLLLESSPINSTLLSWIDEIKTYISTSFLLDEIIVIGEEEKFIPLSSYLSENFSNIPLTVNQNLWLGNMGVLLANQKIPSIPTINIIGREKVGLKIEREVLLRSVLAGALALIIVLSGNMYLNLRIRDIKKERIYLEQNLNERRAEIGWLRKTVEERISLNKGLENWIKELDENRLISPSYFLRDLSRITPVKVWLSNLEFNNDNKILFEGYSLDSEGVADFMIALTYSKIFKDVNLQNSSLVNIGNKSIQNFRIVGVIK